MIASNKSSSVLQVAKKLHLQNRINGCPRVCFSVKNSNKLLIKTHARKGPNVYLYDVKSDEIAWSQQSMQGTQFYVPEDRCDVFCWNNQIVITKSSGTYGSFIRHYEMESGKFLSEFTADNAWTDLRIFRSGILVGCRNGHLYFIDGNSKLKYKFCVKEFNKDYGNIYNIPSPFCITIDKDQNFIAFNYRTELYLLDCELNLLWSKEVETPYRTQRVGVICKTNTDYSWAYEILGVGRNSAKEDIKQAWRGLAFKWHPDRHKPEHRKAAEEKFKKLVNAYELISGIDSGELDSELSKNNIRPGKGPVFFVLPGVNVITKIKFFKKKPANKQYIKLTLNTKKTVTVGVDGEYLEDNKEVRAERSLPKMLEC